MGTNDLHRRLLPPSDFPLTSTCCLCGGNSGPKVLVCHYLVVAGERGASHQLTLGIFHLDRLPGKDDLLADLDPVRVRNPRSRRQGLHLNVGLNRDCPEGVAPLDGVFLLAVLNLNAVRGVGVPSSRVGRGCQGTPTKQGRAQGGPGC